MEADILMQLLFLYFFMYQILCVMLTIRKSQRERMVKYVRRWLEKREK